MTNPTPKTAPQAAVAQQPAATPGTANPVYISFMADVNATTAQGLMGVVCQQIAAGKNEVHLMLSTPGGSVREGLAVYNLLRAVPAKLVTYNVGSVNSIGNMIYLAGEHRIAAPASSFMFHGVGFDVKTVTRLEEKNLRDTLANLTNDQGLIADVIARHTSMSRSEVEALFLAAAFIRADEARGKGIVHDVCDIKLPNGAQPIQLVFQR